MTVAELIEKLREMPQDARVLIDMIKGGYWPLDAVYEDEDDVVLA